jgi:chemotaxis protein MotB
MVELNMLRKLTEDLRQSLANNSEDPNTTPAKLDLTPDGLRISVFDRAKRPIFEAESAEFTPYGVWVFSTLAWQVSRYTNAFQVELEGHTEKGHAPPRPNYGSWEISTDRANSARRLLLEHGVQDEQVRKVAGFADTQPMEDLPPTDEANRRVALLLRVQNTKGSATPPARDNLSAQTRQPGTSRSL